MRKIINKNYSIHIFFTNRLHFAVKYFFLHLYRVLYMYIYYINFEGEQTMNILTRFACAAVLTFAVGAMMPTHADAAAGRFTEAPREVSIVKPTMPAIPNGIIVADHMRVRFLINKQGKVENVFVEQSSGYGPVDEAVKAAIRQWEFTPAIGTDQKAHASIIGMTITLPKGNAPAKSGNGKLTVDKSQTSQASDSHTSSAKADDKGNGQSTK